MHHFLRGEIASQAWFKVFIWLGVSFITPPNLFVDLEYLTRNTLNKKLHKGYWLIWHTIIWVGLEYNKGESFRTYVKRGG